MHDKAAEEDFSITRDPKLQKSSKGEFLLVVCIETDTGRVFLELLQSLL